MKLKVEGLQGGVFALMGSALALASVVVWSLCKHQGWHEWNSRLLLYRIINESWCPTLQIGGQAFSFVFKALALPSLLRYTMLCYRMKDKADGLTQRNIDLVEAEQGCGYLR